MRKITDFISKNVYLITFFIIILVVGFIMGSDYQSTLKESKKHTMLKVQAIFKKN